MMRRSIALLVVLLMVFGPFAQGVDAGLEIGTEMVMMDDVEPPASIVQPDAGELLSNIDGFFTENLGQKGEGAGRFYCMGSSTSIAIGDGWISYVLNPQGSAEGAMYQITFPGSKTPVAIGRDPLEHRCNYFIGNDPGGWITNVRSYREVCLPGLYDGIDLVIGFQPGYLKYEFHVRPFIDPSCIKLHYSGVEMLEVEPNSGDLLIRTSAGSVRDAAPISYQVGPRGSTDVSTSFSLLDETTVAFVLGRYDVGAPLVIDPTVQFSTLIGGTSGDDCRSTFQDEHGNVYLEGDTRSDDIPVTPGAFGQTYQGGSDCYVIKLKEDGSSLVFCTYIGGNSGEESSDVRLDSSGNPVLVGYTGSPDFPTTEGAYQRTKKGNADGFIVKFNDNGSAILFSTYLGGTGNEDVFSIRRDPEDNWVVAGTTSSTDFPVVDQCFDTTHNGGRDNFICVINSNGSRIVRSTYVGGSGDEGFFTCIEIDDEGSIYCADCTSSNDLPTTISAFDRDYNGEGDVYAFKIDSELKTLGYCTYIGGGGSENNWALELDGDGNAMVAGYTHSQDFPTTYGAYDTTYNGVQDGFLVKLNATGNKLDFSTYLGGTAQDDLTGLKIGEDGLILLSGHTRSNDFPVTFDAIKGNLIGGDDCFVVLMNRSGRCIEYGTYFGGTDTEAWVFLENHETNITIIGRTESDDYPTTAGAFDRTYNGGVDLFVTRFNIIPSFAPVPGPPINVSVKALDRIVGVAWEPPEGGGNMTHGGFIIYRGSEEGNLTPRGEVNASTRTYEDDMVTVGERYFYAVSAFNYKGEGNRSSVVNLTVYGFPWPPQVFEAFPGDGNVTLAWRPPSGTGGLPLLGYHVFRGHAPDALELMVTLDVVTTFVDIDVVNGGTYHYKVCAFNSVGMGGPTPEVGPVIPIGPPTGPLSLTAKAEDTKVTLEWLAPANDGGKPIQGCKILRGHSEESLELQATITGQVLIWTDTDLTNGVSYHYAVLAFNEIGDGELSPVVVATPAGFPGAPLDILVEAGDGFILLEWEPPADTGGFPIERYIVYRGMSKTTLVHHVDVEGGETYFNDKGLENGVTLHYVIRADNGVNLGPNSTVISARPLALPQPPGDVRADGEKLAVILTWLPPENDGGTEIIHYRILRGTSTDSLEFLIDADPLYTKYYDFDIEPGTTYHYAISALTEAGEGPSSPTVQATPYGPPGPPMNARIKVGIKEVSIYWEPPEDDGASEVTGYVIERGLSQDSLRKMAELGDVTSYLDTSVTYGQTYFYTIAAVNEAGVGERSPIISGMPIELLAAPSKVTELNVELEGTTATLQWTVPVDDGGSPVTGYVILRGLTKDNLEQIAEVGPAVTTWSEEGLERGTTYFYSVAAKNDVGEGEPILAREVKVPKKVDEGPGFEVLAVMAAMMLVIPMIRRRG